MARHSSPRPALTAPAVASSVIDLIKDDMADRTVPATVRTFAELHDYVDANDYLITVLEQAGVEHDAASEDQALLLNRAMDMVNVWLGAQR